METEEEEEEEVVVVVVVVVRGAGGVWRRGDEVGLTAPLFVLLLGLIGEPAGAVMVEVGEMFWVEVRRVRPRRRKCFVSVHAVTVMGGRRERGQTVAATALRERKRGGRVLEEGKQAKRVGEGRGGAG